MLRSSSFLYHVAILVVSFVCGVAIFHFVDYEQAKVLIGVVEPRLLQEGKGTLWHIILPQIGIIAIIFLLATHAFLKYLVRIVAAIRITFFGFSSVFLLQVISSIWLYATWWFPFQLVYSMLFLVLCEVLVPTITKKQKVGKGRRFPLQAFIFVFFLFACVFIVEFIVISTIFK